MSQTGVFGRYGSYYDLLYRDKDYEAEAQYIARIVRAAAPGARTLLEFGSGTGKHGRLLAKEGFHVLGIERSQSMAETAASSAAHPGADGPGAFACQHGDIRQTDAGRTFDGVLALFHVVSYQTSNADLLDTFRNAARHLHTGGVFVFDVWHGPAVLHERPAVRVKRVADATTRITRLAEPELDVQAGVVTVRYTILAESDAQPRLVTIHEEHRMRYLFATEIALLAGQAGFAVERSEEFLTAHAPSEHTWGVAYVLRKN